MCDEQRAVLLQNGKTHKNLNFTKNPWRIRCFHVGKILREDHIFFRIVCVCASLFTRLMAGSCRDVQRLLINVELAQPPRRCSLLTTPLSGMLVACALPYATTAFRATHHSFETTSRKKRRYLLSLSLFYEPIFSGYFFLFYRLWSSG